MGLIKGRNDEDADGTVHVVTPQFSKLIACLVMLRATAV